MRFTFLKSLFPAAAAMVVAGGVAWAAGPQGGRMAMPEAVAAMLADLEAAAASLPEQSPVREAIEAGDTDRAKAMLGFRPYSEAPLAEGFPSYTPVGVIEVKKYPAYRKAEGPSFWPLYQHIQREGIPMTSPVEMEKPNRGGGAMAFLYQNTNVGATGRALGVRGVTVEDTEPTVAASLGMRGGMAKEAVADARKRLLAFAKTSAEYEPAGRGAFRIFAYNSPGIPERDKYWEMQLVLKKRGG